MATKSILKNISIKNNGSARNLVRALENAGDKRDQQVDLGHSVSEASRAEIRVMFVQNQAEK